MPGIGCEILSHQILQDRSDGLLRLQGVWLDQILRLIVRSTATPRLGTVAEREDEALKEWRLRHPKQKIV